MTKDEIIVHLSHIVYRADKNLTVLLSDNEREAIRKAKELLNDKPDIIRCKDCKLYIQPEQGKVYGRCTYPRVSTPKMQTDFCSCAKMGARNE